MSLISGITLDHFKSARELLRTESVGSAYLSSGCSSLDNFIGGGFLLGTTTEISGEAGCGKSQICMQLTASTIAQGRNVICIETERGFSVKRVRQMLSYRTSDIDGAMQRLLMSSPNTLEQLMHLLTKLERPASQLEETSVLIVDSIATLFRGYHGKEDFQNWERVMTILNNIAVHHNVAVVYVNHITFRHDVLSRRWKAVPFFSHVYSRSPTIRIWLERSLSESQKSGRIIVIKSPFSAKLSSNCFITDRGVSLSDKKCGCT